MKDQEVPLELHNSAKDKKFLRNSTNEPKGTEFVSELICRAQSRYQVIIGIKGPEFFSELFRFMYPNLFLCMNIFTTYDPIILINISIQIWALWPVE